MGSTRPMWVELDLCDGLDLVEFFLTHHSRLGQKIPSTRPMHTPIFFLSWLLLWLVQNFNCNFLPFLAVFVISSWCVGFWISCNDWQALVMEIVFNSCAWIHCAQCVCWKESMSATSGSIVNLIIVVPWKMLGVVWESWIGGWMKILCGVGNLNW